jgi:AMMECR1 domain-containing protein
MIPDLMKRGVLSRDEGSTSYVGAIETIKNAISAATKDPRFHPVQEDELEGLEYCVDVLTPPEKVTNLQELNPKKYGIILVYGNRKGLLLPGGRV